MESRHEDRAASAPRRWLDRLVSMRPGEEAMVLAACAYFFFSLASFYVLRPVRDQLSAPYKDHLAWFYTTTLLGTLLLQPAFAWLVGRFPRRLFVPLALEAFALQLLAFAWLFGGHELEQHRWLAQTFFSWVSVFNVFVTALFWGVMADVFDFEQGKRLFAAVGVGGTLGALCGSKLTEELGELGPQGLALCALGLIQLAVACAWWVGRFQRGSHAPPVEDRALGGRVWDGLDAALRSPFLLLSCGYLLLQTLIQTFTYFEQAELVDAAGYDQATRIGLFASIDLWANAITLVFQVLLTGHLTRWIGIAGTLCALPVLCLLGFGTLGIETALPAVLVLNVAYRGLSHGVSRPSREALFTLVPRADKYKAKSFIDTFVYRAGDLAGSWGFDWLKTFGFGLPAMAWFAVPIAALWLAAGWTLGRWPSRVLTGDDGGSDRG